MGQRDSRQEVSDGVKLYNSLKFNDAIAKWTKILCKSCDLNEKFITLGYLITASFDRGKYRDMINFSAQQIDVAHELDDVQLRAEAYLNLAKANYNICEYHKTLTYSRHCLSNETDDEVMCGNVYLCMAEAFRGLCQFILSAQNYQRALYLARKCKNDYLECQVNSGLGHLMISLKDYDKGLLYHLRAVSLAQHLEICDVPEKFRRLTCFNMGNCKRKLGRVTEALKDCEEAMKAAIANEDRDVQAKCLCLFADAHRRQNEYERALPRYESALAISYETGDQMSQLNVLSGMAKTYFLQKSFHRAKEINLKALDISENIYNKHLTACCHRRLIQLYKEDNSEELVDLHARKRDELVQEIQIKCPCCFAPIGVAPAKLEIFSCGHIIHQVCIKRRKRRHSPNSESSKSSHRLCHVCKSDGKLNNATTDT